MDHRQFDGFARMLGALGNRRGALRVLVGGAFGARWGGLGRNGASAVGCDAGGRGCRRDDQCCSGVCRRGVCRCPAGLTTCDGVSRALLDDAAARLGVRRREVEVMRVEAQDWSNSCLDCEQNGDVSADTIVPGYLVLVAADGNRIAYHTSERDGNFRYCP